MNISTTILTNAMIILTGAIVNFILNNPVAGWALSGCFIVVLIILFILHRKEKK